MKNKSFLFIFLSLFVFSLTCLGQIDPVSVNFNIKTPYTTYLDEYADPVLNKLGGQINLLDNNETSWQIKLRITIESNDLKLVTKNTYNSSPIELHKGIPTDITSSLIGEYFNLQNLTGSGSAYSQIRNNSLPEGFYSFSIEAIDFRTGVVISHKASFMMFLKTYDPPRLILPITNSILTPLQNQNVIFQWQDINELVSYGNSGISYRLLVYELTDVSINPLQAIQSGKALLISQSDPITQSIYQYGLSDPPLSSGKTYLWQVRAEAENGKNYYKNNGYSEIAYFRYGIPDNGTISTISPQEDAGILKGENVLFKWSAPSNFTFGQNFSYNVDVVEITENEDLSAAINKTPVFEFSSNFLSNGQDYQLLSTFRPKNLQKYAWRVNAIDATEKEIAKSEIHTFYGPPLIESFRAYTHTIFVERTYNADLNNLSGRGHIYAGKDTVSFEFQNIGLVEVAGLYVLSRGEIIHTNTTEIPPIKLNPNYTTNGDAYFNANTVKINVDGLFLKGTTSWLLPHAVESGDLAYMYSIDDWLDYNRYTISGTIKIAPKTRFKLADPMGFELVMNNVSQFEITENEFKLNLDGAINLPYKVKNTTDSAYSIFFTHQEQLYYINLNSAVTIGNVKLIDNTGFYLKPKHTIIDLSDEVSYKKIANDNAWKGVYFASFDLVLTQEADKFGDMTFGQKYEIRTDISEQPNFYAYANGTGLNYFYFLDLISKSSYYHTFPVKVRDFRIKIDRNVFTEGNITGTVIIPFISDTVRHAYTVPLASNGFRLGYLLNIENYSYIFSKGQGENEIGITIHRAIFAEKTRLDVIASYHWNSTGLQLDNLDGLRLWGNYNVGFIAPDGTADLTEQKNIVVRTYNVTAQRIGAGRSSNFYSLGVSGDIELGNDISGNNGTPIVNLYSVTKSTLLGEVYTGQGALVPVYNEPIAVTTNNLKTSLTSYITRNEQATQTGSNVLQEIQTSKTSSIDVDEFVATSLEEEQHHTTSADTTLTGDPDFDKLVDIAFGLMNNAFETSITSTKVKSFITKAKGLSANPKSNIKINAKLPDLNRVLHMAVDVAAVKLTAGVRSKVNAKADTVCKKFQVGLNKKLLKTDSIIDKLVNRVIDSLGLKIENTLASKDLDVDHKKFVAACDSLKKDLRNEIKRSYRASINNNITVKFNNLIKVKVAGRINDFILTETKMLGYDLIDNNKAGQININTIFNNATNTITDIQNDVLAEVDPNQLEETLKNTAIDAITGIDLGTIIADLTKQILGSTIEAYVDKQVTTLITKGINSFSGNSAMASSVASNITSNVKMDFNNIGDKLRDGKIDQIIAFDPTNIVIVTSATEIRGSLIFTHDDPVWGDSWQATLDAKIKQPAPGFTIGAKFIKGQKDGYHYWLASVYGTGLSIPLTPIPLTLVGASGGVYHHIMREPNGDYRPNNTVNYGVKLHIYLQDTPGRGKLILLDVGAEMQFLDQDIILDIDGHINVCNASSFSLVSGIGNIHYSTVDHIFKGTFDVTVNAAPIICAHGQLGITIDNSSWEVYVGKKTSPIIADILCLGLIKPESYFVINNQGAETGLHLDFGFSIETPWFGVAGANAQGYAYANLLFDAYTKVDWSPLKVRKVKVLIDFAAGVGVRYEIECYAFTESGTFDFASVAIHGLIDFSNEPEYMSLVGEASGRVTVLGCSAGLNFGVNYVKTK